MRLWEANYNQGDVRAIALSIRRFGYCRPVVLWQDNLAVAGNHTSLALRQLKQEGWAPKGNIHVEGETWFILFGTASHLATWNEAMAYAIADNEAARQATRDEALLAQYIRSLPIDLLEATTLPAGEVSQLLDQFREDAGGLLESDEPPAQIGMADELQQKWQTAEGQLWTIGDHRLLCGDSTTPDHVERLLGGATPMIMVTDPPYGVEYDPAWRAEIGLNQNDGKMGVVENDDRHDWREAWALFPGDVAYVWHAGRFGSEVAQSLQAAGFEIAYQIIWNKDRFALGRGDYHWKHEPCWYAVKQGAGHHWNGARDQSTVWDIARADDAGHGHGTQKPLECMERPIRNHEGDIYEPFAGSGTTLVAAERHRRRCYAIEISPAYVAVILERLTAMGLTPKLEEAQA
ncbi:MAG: DNA modification methylase [Rhodothermales bacterium]